MCNIGSLQHKHAGGGNQQKVESRAAGQGGDACLLSWYYHLNPMYSAKETHINNAKIIAIQFKYAPPYSAASTNKDLPT